MNEPLFGYSLPERLQSPEQGVRLQRTENRPPVQYDSCPPDDHPDGGWHFLYWGHAKIRCRSAGYSNEWSNQGIYMESFTSYALRDTFATRYIEQGGNPQTLKSILGHSSFSITMDLYSYVLPDTKQEKMNRIVII